MNVMTHTPGPWTIDWQYIVAPDPTGTHPDLYIAEVMVEDEEGRVPDAKQIEANARLLAAAPEMLRTLMRIELCTSGWGGNPRLLLKAINEMATEAINKAIGEQA